MARADIDDEVRESDDNNNQYTAVVRVVAVRLQQLVEPARLRPIERRKPLDDALDVLPVAPFERLLGDADPGQPVVENGLLLMQMRAAQGFFSSFERTDRRRAELDIARKVPDREILARFPRFVIPTYLGDDELFASEAFCALLPDDWPLEYRQLDQIIHR